MWDNLLSTGGGAWSCLKVVCQTLLTPNEALTPSEVCTGWERGEGEEIKLGAGVGMYNEKNEKKIEKNQKVRT